MRYSFIECVGSCSKPLRYCFTPIDWIFRSVKVEGATIHSSQELHQPLRSNSMADHVFPTSLASTHHSRSRSLSPSKLSSTRPHAHFGSSNDQNGFEDIILAPPVALTPHLALHTTASHDEQDYTSQRSRPPARTFRQSFLETCKLPPLNTRSPGGGILGQAQASTLSLPALSFGKRDTETQASPPRSPTKERWAFMPAFTGDKSGVVRVEDKGGRLTDWFSGSSAPVNLGILPSPTKEKEDTSMKTSYTSPAASHPYRLHKKTTSESALGVSHPNASRFSFFGAKPTAPEQHPDSAASDELLNLDINAALFPGGPADPFSPSSFHNLLTNAEGLLRRLQTAYKQRTISLHEITSENSAQREELEEAEMRSQHLKLQLDDMAAKVAERDEAVRRLGEELASERQQRRDEEEARKRSIILVGKPRGPPQLSDEAGEMPLPNRQRKKRDSNRTIASDSGFESEDDCSSAASVFSRTHDTTSPTTTTSSTPSAASPESFQNARSFTTVAATRQVPALRPALGPQRPSTFQKILKGLSTSTTTASDVPDCTNHGQWGCANCQGGHAAEAWSVVGVLKDENQGLKKRVGELEGAVEGCLGIVGGL